MADLVAFAGLWLVGWWLLWRVRVPGPAAPGTGADRPPVSLVVPARDEEATLPTLLASLAPELGPDDEVVVVDDHSTDATAAVAGAGGARVVAAPDLPAGWVGKTWACHRGVGRARHDLLVLLDADTRLLPGGLDRLVALHRERRGLLSVQPFHVVPRPVERLAAFFNVVGMMGTGAFTPLGDRATPRAAFGPCLVTTVDDYRRSGGHQHPAVRGSVVDDVALAARYRAAGLPVHLRGGRGTVTFRMYPGGLGPLVEGFTKNLSGGLRAARPLGAVLVAAWLAACVAPAVLLTRVPLLVAAGCYLVVAAQVHTHLRRIGSFGALTAALYAVPLLVFLGVFGVALLRGGVRGRVSWKGRAVSTRRAGTPPPGSSAARPRSP